MNTHTYIANTIKISTMRITKTSVHCHICNCHTLSYQYQPVWRCSPTVSGTPRHQEHVWLASSWHSGPSRCHLDLRPQRLRHSGWASVLLAWLSWWREAFPGVQRAVENVVYRTIKMFKTAQHAGLIPWSTQLFNVATLKTLEKMRKIHKASRMLCLG